MEAKGMEDENDAAKDGTDDLANLRPLQWNNNPRKADGNLQCAVRSEGNKNVGA
jgi:hypothetical protein